MELVRIINSSDEMVLFGETLGRYLKENMVILMEGDVGAGKTTLTKGIAKALGVNRIVNSPTFTILKIYEGNLTLYHMDVYRLNNDSGDEYLEEYFEAGGVTVIEWAHQVSAILPKNFILITISYIDSSTRKITLEVDENVKGNSEYLELLSEVAKQ